ncbi:MAG TPA: hypothetical protein VF051_06800 [Hyphomicrobiaceae bacterium]|jgi:hypothetical protein
MIRYFACTAAVMLLLAGPAGAQQAQVPSTPDDCLKAAFDLAQAAEEKSLAEDVLDKVEEALQRMEGHCDANQFSEAMAVATDIQTLIDGR